MTWPSAALRSLVIVAYFIVFTVWLPNTILQLGAVASATSFVRDALVTAVWGIALVAGLYGLRVSQKAGLI